MDVSDLFLKQLTDVANDVKNIAGRFEVLDRRLTKIESDLVTFSASSEFQAKLYQQIDLRVVDAHKRLEVIEKSPVMTVNSLAKVVAEKVLLIITGAIALWIVTKVVPGLIGH